MTIDFIKDCFIMSPIEYIYVDLCDFKSGLVVVDQDNRGYVVSLTKKTVIQEFDLPLQLRDRYESQRPSVVSSREGGSRGSPSKMKKVPEIPYEANMTLRHVARQDGSNDLYFHRQGAQSVTCFKMGSLVDLMADLGEQFDKTKVALGVQKAPFVQSNGIKVFYPLALSSLTDELVIIDQERSKKSFSVLYKEYITCDYIVDTFLLADTFKFKLPQFIANVDSLQVAINLQLRIFVFVDEQTGVLCVVSQQYRTRKWVYLEERLRIK